MWEPVPSEHCIQGAGQDGSAYSGLPWGILCLWGSGSWRSLMALETTPQPLQSLGRNQECGTGLDSVICSFHCSGRLAISLNRVKF